MIRRLLLACAVALVGLSTGTLPAAAEPGPVTVTIDQLAPVVPTSESTLTVSGAVRNQGSDALNGAQARLRVSETALSSESEVAQVSLGESVRTGAIVASANLGPTSAGAKSGYSLSVPIAALGLPGPGVYQVSVEVVGSDGSRVASMPTVLPWFPSGTGAAPTSVVWLWPLLVQPARDADNVILTPAVAAQFAPGGRLQALLAVASRHADEVSWLLDPQTQQTATTLAGAHRTLVDATSQETPANPDAAAWTDLLRRSLTPAAVDVTATGYANPDSPAQVAAGLDGQLVLATTTAAAEVSDQVGRTVRGGFSAPPSGRVDQTTLNVLRTAGVDLVALADDGVADRGDAPVAELSADSGPISALVSQRQLTDALLGLSDPERAVRARQQFLALTLIDALNNPGGTVVVQPPTYWAPAAAPLEELVTATATAPWSRLTRLGDLLTATTTSGDPTAASLTPYGPFAQAAQLPPDYLAETIRSTEALDSLNSITVQPGDLISRFRNALLRCTSAAWRADRQTGTLLMDRTSTQINDEIAKVRINGAATVAFPGERGSVPITVSNDLSVPVSVGISMTATPAYRLEAGDVAPLTIPPGQRVSVEVPITIVGSEPLRVTSQLTTPTGEPYGASDSFELRTTAYSRAAAWVVAAAAAALILLLVWSTVGRIRRARRGEAGGD